MHITRSSYTSFQVKHNYTLVSKNILEALPLKIGRYYITKRAPAHELPSLMLVPIVPNSTKKHTKLFNANKHALPLHELEGLDYMAAHAAAVSHTPGLLIRARGVTQLLLDRFSGPSALDHFNTPFASESGELPSTSGIDPCRSTFPWLFLSKDVPSLQTQPLAFVAYKPLSPTEDTGFKWSKNPFLFEIRVFLLNMDLPALQAINPDAVIAVLTVVEKVLSTFSTTLKTKYPELTLPIATGAQTTLNKNRTSRASMDSLTFSDTDLKVWNLHFKKEEDLLRLILMLKSQFLNSHGLMISTEDVSSKIAKKWI